MKEVINIRISKELKEKLKKQFKEIAKNQGYTISGLANKIFGDYIKKNKEEQ